MKISYKYNIIKTDTKNQKNKTKEKNQIKLKEKKLKNEKFRNIKKDSKKIKKFNLTYIKYLIFKLFILPHHYQILFSLF